MQIDNLSLLPSETLVGHRRLWEHWRRWWSCLPPQSPRWFLLNTLDSRGQQSKVCLSSAVCRNTTFDNHITGCSSSEAVHRHSQFNTTFLNSNVLNSTNHELIWPLPQINLELTLLLGHSMFHKRSQTADYRRGQQRCLFNKYHVNVLQQLKFY